MAFGTHRAHRHLFAGLKRRQAAAGGARIARVPALGCPDPRIAVRRKPEMAVEDHGRAFGGKGDSTVLAGQFDPHPLDPGRGHLAGQRAAPDQAVEPRRVPVEMARDRFGSAPEARGPDRLMGLLRVARPGPEGPRPGRDAVRAEALRDRRARLGDGGPRHRGRIRARIGDEARGLGAELDALVEPLGDRHGLADPEAEPAERRQLQGRGREGRVGRPVQGVALDGDRPEPRLADAPGRLPRRRFPRHPGLADRGPVQTHERRGEGNAVLRRRLGLHGPVLPRHEGLDPGLALADQAQRHRLHPARRAAARQLAPQHRRQAVAHQVVERPARLPRLDQVHVDPARIVERRPDRLFGHLVEGCALDPPVADRVPFGEPVQHLPGDRLALPVRVRGEDQPVGARQRPGDRAERPGRPPPGLGDHGEAVLRLHRPRLRGQVRDMAPGRQDPA